jgi:hypothetical protein
LLGNEKIGKLLFNDKCFFMSKEYLFELLVTHGGEIVSSNDLSADDIAQARASDRMYVDENSLGYVWQPPFKNGIPTTEEEVGQFEKWFPLPIKLPKELETCEWLFEKRVNPELN